MKTKVAKKMAVKKKMATKKASVTKVAKKRGRASSYLPTTANLICKRIADGESLKSVCSERTMPDCETVRKWLRDFPEFLGNYTRAREEQADYYADEMVTIADTSTDSNKARLQIDARKWKASKMAPKKYGDKLDITTRDETPPITREGMIERMRKSPAFMAEIENMVAEAKRNE